MCATPPRFASFEGDLDAADAGFVQAVTIAEQFRAPELLALARVGHGRCLIYLGEITEGMALLDEAMVAISAQEVSRSRLATSIAR